jgi:hypothetical protein
MPQAALLPVWMTTNVMAVFIIFVVVIFLLYRMFKLVIKAILVASAGFAFPWVIKYLNLQLPIPIPADIETGVRFALIALLLLLIYEFFHFIVAFFKLITTPIRWLFRRRTA